MTRASPAELEGWRECLLVQRHYHLRDIGILPLSESQKLGDLNICVEVVCLRERVGLAPISPSIAMDMMV